MAYQVIDRLTGQPVGKTFTDKKAARKTSDRLDSSYGGIRYIVRLVAA